MMRMFWYAGLLLLAGIVLSACQSGDLNVGQSVIKPQELLIQSIDSVSVKTSTVLRPDSFVTTNDADIVLGYWKDAQAGKLSARTFTSLDYTGNSLASQTNLVLDSLFLELNYSFAYGDTTSLFNVSVHRLTKPLNPGQLYYSTSTAPYEAKPLAQTTVAPQPKTLSRQVRLRMPADLATTLYNKLVNSEIIDGTTLADFLPGFVFQSTSTSNAFVGFSATTSGLRLYYHATDINQTASTVLFPITNTHFSQLTPDRSGTVLNALQQKSDAVDSRQTDNTTFVALGAGLQTRVEFPYLSQFARPDQFVGINSALLVIGPVRRDLTDNTPPPSQLTLYSTNTVNEIVGSVPGGSTGASAASGSYVYDGSELTLTDTYTIDLTQYISQILKGKIVNQPLILTLPSTSTGQYSLRSLIQRVTLGGPQRQNDQIKLKLFIASGV